MAINELEIGNKVEIVAKIELYSDIELKLNNIANMTFLELESYIDTNVIDLPTAKDHLKLQGSVLLALTKLIKDRFYK